MKRFKPIYIVLPLIILLLFTGVQPVQAIDFGDIFGAAFGFGVGSAICAGVAVIGTPIAGAGCFALKTIFSLFGLFGGLDFIGGATGNIAAALIGGVVIIINSFLIIIGWLFFSLANGFIDVALEMNSSIQDSSVVREGFNIVLNIANLGLVVAIVAIAFMVMLRRPKATALLPRFIAVALLINFSFLIVTNFLIEPVNQVTETLRQAANFDFASFSSVFAPDLDLGNLMDKILKNPPQNIGASGAEVLVQAPDWAVSIMVSLFSILFTTAFMVIGAIVLFSFAAMLFMRYIALGFLIVIMPIAWIAWIFPNLKIPGGNPFNVWWEAFMRWLLFAPISMFFFFLAIRAVTAQDVLDLVNPPGDDLESGLAQFGTAIANMIIIIGFLLGGLVVANKMSITGASYALATIKKGGKYVRKYTAGKAKLGGIRITNAAIKRLDKGKDGDKKRLEDLQRSVVLSKIPLVGRGVKAAGRGVMTATAKSEQYIMKEEEKRFEGLPPYMVEQMYHGLPNDLQKLAALTHMQKEGYMWESSIADDIGRMKSKGLIKKYGLQKFDLGAAGEGIVSDVFEAKERGADKEELAAILKKTLDKLSPADIGKFSPYLFTNYNSDKPQFGFKTEQEFNDYRELVTNYLVEYRPEAYNGLRSRQTGSGQAYLNRTLEKFAGEGGTFEDQVFAHLGDAKKRAGEYIDSADPKKKTVKFSEATDRDKERHIQTHWKEVSTDLSKVYDNRIDARTDLDTEGKDKEKERVKAELESIGPEGFIARHVHQGRARKGGFMFTPFSTDTTSTSEEAT